VACIVLGKVLYDHTRYDTEWLKFTGVGIAVIFGVVVLVCGVAMIDTYAKADALVAENHEKYKALTYQLENNLYDNDNDIGKKQLYDEIREWNEDLAYYQSMQYDFWLGIFYPDVFDQFEFIDYGGQQWIN
jgi:hypothetical protein